MAVLEESKAQLQMELVREKNKSSQPPLPCKKCSSNTAMFAKKKLEGGIELRKQRSPPPRSPLRLTDNEYNFVGSKKIAGYNSSSS